MELPARSRMRDKNDMKVITAGTKEFAEIILAQQSRCLKFGYDHIAYDLGDLGFGIPWNAPRGDLDPLMKEINSIPPTKFKVDLLLENYGPGDTVCWIDGDCLPVRDFLPAGEWDAAVTLRREDEIGKSGIHATDYLNAGVCFFRDRTLLLNWKDECRFTINDQDALNIIVGENYSREDWIEALAKEDIINSQGFRIKILKCEIFNSWYFVMNGTPKIIHFKRGFRHLASEYIKWTS